MCCCAAAFCFLGQLAWPDYKQREPLSFFLSFRTALFVIVFPLSSVSSFNFNLIFFSPIQRMYFTVIIVVILCYANFFNISFMCFLFLLLPLFVSSVLFLDTNSMSRESDDNLSSINSAYTGKQTISFICILFTFLRSSFITWLCECVSQHTRKKKERKLY